MTLLPKKYPDCATLWATPFEASWAPHLVMCGPLEVKRFGAVGTVTGQA